MTSEVTTSDAKRLLKVDGRYEINKRLAICKKDLSKI